MRFLSDGFAIVENVYSHAECDELIFEIDKTRSDRAKAGVRSLMSNLAVRNAAESERLIAVVEALSGERMLPYKATLFEKTGKANWLVAFHQDTALPVEQAPELDGWGPSSVKDGITFSHAPTSVLRRILALRIHLDESTLENGSLRVIPGSHQRRVLDDGEFEQIVSQGPIVECPVGKGGVIAMSPLIFHASSKIRNDLPRRVLHIEYTSSFDLDEGVRLATA